MTSYLHKPRSIPATDLSLNFIMETLLDGFWNTTFHAIFAEQSETCLVQRQSKLFNGVKGSWL